ncbi:MAG: SWF/SNF helicase family protein, partial [Gemmatimonadota bacterium]|nr:SWF/SNF helicase family protein [Gemmatimonadota bacterium]
ELRAWSYAEGTLQLAFPEIASDALPSDANQLLAATERHASHVAALIRASADPPDPDDARAALIRRVRAEHPGERVIVFAEFAETVRALSARLAPDGGVAMLTDRGATVAGGRIARRELLAQFAPGGAAGVAPANRVSLLVTTDLLSEGVNLQDASVVVHADLPWSPARFEQRVGRARRLGSAHARVSVYALRPPAPAEMLLHMEQRLRAKLAAAARTVGIQGTIMPRLFPSQPATRPAAATHAEIAARLDRWRESGEPPSRDEPFVAAVDVAHAGFLALVGVEGRPELIADLGAGISESPCDVAEALRLAEGPDLPVDQPAARDALTAIACWLAERESFGVFGLAVGAAARTRRRLLHRIDAIAARSPRHLRSSRVPLARAARRVATERLSAGAERVLQELADARMPDEAWLNAVRTFAELNGGPGTEVEVKAVIVFATSTAR